MRAEMEDSRGALCRNRRLFGTLERLRYGWARQDREGGEGGRRSICPSSCGAFGDPPPSVRREGRIPCDNRNFDLSTNNFSAVIMTRTYHIIIRVGRNNSTFSLITFCHILLCYNNLLIAIFTLILLQFELGCQ